MFLVVFCEPTCLFGLITCVCFSSVGFIEVSQVHHIYRSLLYLSATIFTVTSRTSVTAAR